ncbi:MAG: alpha/beta hydrolase [Actinomycetota bacterium]|nr:alpha/beta hydrolase [Actinomycetota bacterium]
MSTPQDPPQPIPPAGRQSILPGIVIGVLVFALIAGGVIGVVKLRDKDSATGASSSGASSSPTQAPTSPGALPSADPRLAKFYAQKLSWNKCAGNDQCATMKVPLDYAAPGGRSIDLKLLKVPASGSRVGSLVVNPGGPGASGIQYAQSGAAGWPARLLSRFDLVGFDPRGVGSSTPLHCMDTAQTDRLVASDPDPDTATERTTMDNMLRAFGSGCLRKSGQLAKHMSTVEVAKDMDVLRQLLGESRLTYFGASYGTLIGATYANLFPTHVGRMVLDGAIDPALSTAQISLAQGHGFEVALRAYVQDCVSRGNCLLGGSVDAGTKRIRTFLAEVEKKPLPTNAGRELAVGNAVLGIWLPLYVKTYWPLLTSALGQAINNHDGTALLTLADQYVSRGPSGYRDNSLESLYAVNCLDHDDSIPTSQVPSHFPQFLKASPTFGKAFAYSLSTCAVWPVHSGNATKAMHAKGAPPIVVVGTTRDPATPLAWAQGLARELDSGTLITRNGDGHTGYNRGNACVDNAVNGYLIDGTVPKKGLMC